MRKVRIIGLVVAGVIVVGLAALFLIGYFRPKIAGIYIETAPSAAVYINGQQVGRTPYRDTMDPGEITIKLIPDSFEKPLAPYEDRISLVNGVETVVKRNFGEFDETSEGEVISFEKIENEEVGLVVVTIPNSVQLVIDGYQKSITPHKTSSISEGEHVLKMSANGFKEREIKVKTHKGYKLTAVVQLAKTEGQVVGITPTPTSTEEEEDVEKVKISETPTGFLRVRAEPSTLGKEVGQVEPGEVYELIETDEVTGWYKIEFGEEESGWISNQYAEKVSGEKETESKTTPTSTPRTTPKITPSLAPKPTIS